MYNNSCLVSGKIWFKQWTKYPSYQPLLAISEIIFNSASHPENYATKHARLSIPKLKSFPWMNAIKNAIKINIDSHQSVRIWVSEWDHIERQWEPNTLRVSRGCTDTGVARNEYAPGTYYSTVNKRGRLSATPNSACALTPKPATSHPIFLLPIPEYRPDARNLYSDTAMSQFPNCIWI